MNFNLRLQRSQRAVWFRRANSLLFALLLAGCASDAKQPDAEPGSGVREYQRVALNARNAVNASVSTLDVLARPGGATGRAVKNFDDALHQLEVVSVSVRARAEAIMARGEMYFDEWSERLSERAGSPGTAGEAERYARLREKFEQLRHSTRQARDEFKPYMAGLREFRATLGGTTGGPSRETVSRRAGELAGSGRRVQSALTEILADLESAAAELKNVSAGKRSEVKHGTF